MMQKNIDFTPLTDAKIKEHVEACLQYNVKTVAQVLDKQYTSEQIKWDSEWAEYNAEWDKREADTANQYLEVLQETQ